MLRIDPWGVTDIDDYTRLFTEFGIEPMEPLISRIPQPHRYIRRGLIFGHRDFQLILKAIYDKERFAVMSGLKPSNVYHFGNLMTAEEVVYFQRLGGEAFFCIADVEAYADNAIPFDESEKIALNNIADVLALGLDPKRAYIYRQSKEIRVMNLATIFSRGVTKAMMEAIYGERPFGLYLSALIQAGDILMAQLKDFGGPKPVLVPVGIDQDPHIRLTRDLARRFQEDFNFILPSATLHKLIRSLTGGKKMSKREPMGMLTTDDDPELIERKIKFTFTGGRATEAEQRSLGGEPLKCVVYEYCLFHLIEDDKELERVFDECIRGERLCGECKSQVYEAAVRFLVEHQRRKASAYDKAREILGVA